MASFNEIGIIRFLSIHTLPDERLIPLVQYTNVVVKSDFPFHISPIRIFQDDVLCSTVKGLKDTVRSVQNIL